MDGVLNINKSSGATSHDVVAQVRRVTGQKRVGHTGTLDPEATGVLLICIGKATRIVEYLTDLHKSYRAVAVLGVETDTEDSTGNVIGETDCRHIDREAVEAVIPRFIGKIMQTPPMVSAVKHEGERLYKLAREGKVVERKPREVEIYSLDLTDFTPGSKPKFELHIECSKGTYIRTICADIGKALGCGGCMESLVRTSVGKYTLADSHTVEEVELLADEGRLSEVVHTIDEALSDMPSLEVTEMIAHALQNGVALSEKRLAEEEISLPPETEILRIYDPNRRLMAIAKILIQPDKTRCIAPHKVLV